MRSLPTYLFQHFKPRYVVHTARSPNAAVLILRNTRPSYSAFHLAGAKRRSFLYVLRTLNFRKKFLVGNYFVFSLVSPTHPPWQISLNAVFVHIDLYGTQYLPLTSEGCVLLNLCSISKSIPSKTALSKGLYLCFPPKNIFHITDAKFSASWIF